MQAASMYGMAAAAAESMSQQSVNSWGAVTQLSEEKRTARERVLLKVMSDRLLCALKNFRYGWYWLLFWVAVRLGWGFIFWAHINDEIRFADNNELAIFWVGFVFMALACGQGLRCMLQPNVNKLNMYIGVFIIYMTLHVIEAFYYFAKVSMANAGEIVIFIIAVISWFLWMKEALDLRTVCKEFAICDLPMSGIRPFEFLKKKKKDTAAAGAAPAQGQAQAQGQGKPAAEGSPEGLAVVSNHGQVLGGDQTQYLQMQQTPPPLAAARMNPFGASLPPAPVPAASARPVPPPLPPQPQAHRDDDW